MIIFCNNLERYTNRNDFLVFNSLPPARSITRKWPGTFADNMRDEISIYMSCSKPLLARHSNQSNLKAFLVRYSNQSTSEFVRTLVKILF